MYVSTHYGAGHRSHRRQIGLVLLSALLCSSATVAVAGSAGRTEGTALQLERFAFTGTYRFKLILPTRRKRAVKRIVVTPSSQRHSRQTNQPARGRQGPRRRPSVAIGGGAPATVYIVPRKTQYAIINRRPIASTLPTTPSQQTAARHVRLTTPPKAPLSRDRRSSLGATPRDTLETFANNRAPNPVASPAPSQQPSGQSSAASVAKAVQQSLPMVRIAVSTPATSAVGRDPQAVTLQPSGRTINVPPLPELNRRPAGTTRTRNTNRTKRIAKRAAKPQPPKSVQSKPYSIFSAQPAWANGALFKSD